MKTLHLTLKKKWFDMILSGEKTEEYRELKLYWQLRFIDEALFYATKPYRFWDKLKDLKGTTWQDLPLHRLMDPEKHLKFFSFDKIIFKNGYSKEAPSFEIECLGIEIGEGNPEWGAEPDEKYFKIKLGKILTN